MTSLFSVPDKEKNYQGYMLYVLCILWSVVTGVVVSIGFYHFPHIWTRWLTYLSTSIFIGLFNLTLSRLGYTRLASWTFTIMLWLYITIPCYSAGGIRAPGILSQTSVILTAGFLLGWRGGLVIGLLTMGADFWLAYIEVHGQLPIPTVNHDPITRWIGAIIPFGTILALQYYATNHLRIGLIALQREIKEREKAEEAVKKSELWHRALVENISDAITVVNEQKQIIYRSPSVERITGYTLEEAKEGTLLSFIHPDDKERAAVYIDKAFRTPGTVLTDQFRLLHKKGHYIWIEVTLINLLAHESVKGVIINFQDVTDRVNAQEIINKRESELTAFFENAEGAASLIDTEKRYVLFNKRFAYDHKLLTGLEPVPGSKVYEHFALEIQEARNKLLDEVLQGQKKIVEVDYVRNGRRVYYRTAYYPVITAGKITGLTTYSIDLTENKEAQLALMRSEEKHRALTENITDGIMLLDENFENIYQSPSVEKITGYTIDDGSNKKVLDFIHPEDLEIAGEFFQHARANPGAAIQNQFRVQHKQGHYIWIEGTVMNLLHNDSVKAFIVNYRDITERKLAEQEILLLNNSLEQKVEDRTMRLREANKALESFSYTVAHDLRAPVRAMLGFTKIIEQEYMPAFSDDLKGLFGHINISGKRMSAIIEDLLTLARYEKVELKTSVVDMEKLFRQVWNNILLNNPHKAELAMDALPPALADGSLIEQVAVNLLSNAVKYSSKKEKPVVRISFEQGDGTISYIVKDNGAGFDMKNYNRLFGAFQRLHGMSEFEGTGVGLLLVKRIIEKHGGVVRAEGVVGEGATFYFTLPVALPG